MRPVLAVLGCALLARMVLVIHTALVVLGMLTDSLPCCRQVGTGIHLEDKVKMQSQNTLPPPGNLDQGWKDTEVVVDSQNAADIQVATRKLVVTDIQVVTDNDLMGDIQVVYYQDHRVVELVLADTVGRRQDSVPSTTRL